MTQSTPLSSPVAIPDLQSSAYPDPAKTLRRKRLESLGRWSFILPVLILNFIVIVIPTLFSFYIAFTKWSGFGTPEFVGLQNFQELFQDNVFFKALGNNLLWTAAFLTVPVFLGLTGAYLMSGIKRGQVFYRLFFFIPYVISSVVNTQIWRFILNPRTGIGSWLAERGITFLDFAILGNRNTALLGVAFVDNWHFWGFLVVIYLAAMSAVDTELYEVARLDGATRFQQFRFVTLPSIRPTLVFTILMIIIWSSLTFDYVYILTGGGPAHASEVMSTYLYDQAFYKFEIGYAASVGIMMTLWVMIAVSIFVILRKERLGDMMGSRRTASTLPNHIFLGIMAIFAIFPVLVLLINSVKTTGEIAVNPFGLPQEIRLQNYIDAFEQGSFATTLGNSTILTVGTIIGTLILAGLAAFALARLRLKGSDFLGFYFMIGTSVPPQLFMIPLFYMWKQVGLVNSHIGLIIIYCALHSPFGTFLLRSYMVAIPEEFVEAARIDGASHWQVYRFVILPLSWPGFLTVGLVVGLQVWNEFLFALTFLQKPELKPVSTSLFAFQQQFFRDWGLTNAGSIIMVLPVIVLFLLLQRRFIEGLTQGGLKA